MAEVPADPGKEVLSSREQWETPAGLTLLFPAPFVSRHYSRDHNTPLKCSSNGRADHGVVSGPEGQLCLGTLQCTVHAFHKNPQASATVFPFYTRITESLGGGMTQGHS